MNRSLPGVALCTTALVVTLAAKPAGAEVRPSELIRPADAAGYGPGYGRRVTSYELEVGFYTDSTDIQDVFLISPLVRVIQPVRSNEVELLWGFSAFSVTGPAQSDPSREIDQSTVRLANPYLAHHWVWRELPYQVRLGVGLTAPAATLREETLNDTLVDVVALAATQAMYGHHEFFLWVPETMSAVLHADGYLREHFGLVYGGQINLANMYGFNDLVNDGYHVGLEVALDVAYELEWARFALRGIYFNALTSDADDTDQISVEPELRFRLGFADLFTRLTMPIDEPSGFAFDEGKIWGAHIGIGSPTERHLPPPPKGQ